MEGKLKNKLLIYPLCKNCPEYKELLRESRWVMELECMFLWCIVTVCKDMNQFVFLEEEDSLYCD